MVDRPRPRGAEAVRSALMSAANQLNAERTPRTITVREIADLADVNPGLVHKYFGSKDSLIREATEQLASTMEATAEAGDQVRDSIGPLFEKLVSESAMVRTLASVLLEGADVAELRGRHGSAMETALHRAIAEIREQPTQVESQIMVAAIASTMLGWVVFSEYIKMATALDDRDDSAVRAELVRVCEGLIDWNRKSDQLSA